MRCDAFGHHGALTGVLWDVSSECLLLPVLPGIAILDLARSREIWVLPFWALWDFMRSKMAEMGTRDCIGTVMPGSLESWFMKCKQNQTNLTPCVMGNCGHDCRPSISTVGLPSAWVWNPRIWPSVGQEGLTVLSRHDRMRLLVVSVRRPPGMGRPYAVSLRFRKPARAVSRFQFSRKNWPPPLSELLQMRPEGTSKSCLEVLRWPRPANSIIDEFRYLIACGY